VDHFLWRGKKGIVIRREKTHPALRMAQIADGKNKSVPRGMSRTHNMVCRKTRRTLIKETGKEGIEYGTRGERKHDPFTNSIVASTNEVSWTLDVD